MRRKITIELVRSEFAKEGYQLLSTVYVNSKTKLEYICPNGHHWSISWTDWKSGYRCPICANNCKRLTIDFIQEAFRKKGYILLTTKYINNKQKLEYICPNGHHGSIRWADFQQGYRCPICVSYKKLKFIREQFAKEGYWLLSTVYVNGKTKLEYICDKGHHCKISWNSWKAGHRCKQCSKLSRANKLRLDIKFIRKELAKESYELLTKIYTGVHQKLKYRCPKGHYWSITWSDWKSGARCRFCYLESIRGKKNPRHYSNLTNRNIYNKRDCPEYKEWRASVYKRDNYTCQICGKKGGKLNAHHLESFSSNKVLQLVESNGVCMCEPCHKEFHRLYGYGNNTRKQFEEFKKNYNPQKKLK